MGFGACLEEKYLKASLMSKNFWWTGGFSTKPNRRELRRMKILPQSTKKKRKQGNLFYILPQLIFPLLCCPLSGSDELQNMQYSLLQDTSWPRRRKCDVDVMKSRDSPHPVFEDTRVDSTHSFVKWEVVKLQLCFIIITTTVI